MLAWKNGTISRLLWKVLQELDTKERNSIIILLASLIKFWFHFILYSCPIPSNSCIIHHIKHIKLWLTEKIKSNFEGNEHIFAGNYNFFLLILVFLTRKLKAVTECFKTRTASLIKQFGNLYNISVYEITSRKAQKITKVIVHRMRIRLAILRYKKKKSKRKFNKNVDKDNLYKEKSPPPLMKCTLFNWSRTCNLFKQPTKLTSNTSCNPHTNWIFRGLCEKWITNRNFLILIVLTFIHTR